jgi:acylphosphatase
LTAQPPATAGDRAGDPAPGQRVRRRVLVSGRVQGVWFRESCRAEALTAGVTGWVRNLSDGRVEAVLEGPSPAVERVVAWCRSGPRQARVDAVDVSVETPAGEAGFRVR